MIIERSSVGASASVMLYAVVSLRTSALQVPITVRISSGTTLTVPPHGVNEHHRVDAHINRSQSSRTHSGYIITVLLELELVRVSPSSTSSCVAAATRK